MYTILNMSIVYMSIVYMYLLEELECEPTDEEADKRDDTAKIGDEG